MPILSQGADPVFISNFRIPSAHCARKAVPIWNNADGKAKLVDDLWSFKISSLEAERIHGFLTRDELGPENCSFHQLNIRSCYVHADSKLADFGCLFYPVLKKPTSFWLEPMSLKADAAAGLFPPANAASTCKQ